MKWKFRKEENDISVSVLYFGEETEHKFSYVDMVKKLYTKEKIESVEYEGDFSETEKKSIEELRNKINSCIDDNSDFDKELNLSDNNIPFDI